MRFHQTIAANSKHLRRIAALLAALADLAQSAAGRSRAVCLLVLWLIRPAEVAARDWLDRVAPGAAWLPASEPLRPETAAAEALRLAQSFRVLAAILAALAEYCLPPRSAAPANHRFAAPVATLDMRPTLAIAIGRLDSS